MQDVKTATTEASKMLEAALQQMDGIISSTAGGGAGAPLTLSERNIISVNNVLSTAKTLALALQQVGVRAPAPDPVTAAIISDWLETHIPRQDADERMRRLLRDKESLALQYQMLAERVSEQADKIIELEGLLTEKTQLLGSKEEQLQRHMISRSALETQKLELMSALSELKLHRVALECENVDIQLENGNDGGGDNLERRIPFGSVGNLNQRNYVGSQIAPKTPPASLRHQILPQFHSLPRSHGTASKHNNKSNNNNNHSRAVDANANNARQRNVAFASNERILIDSRVDGAGITNNDAMYGSFTSQSNSTPSPNLRERAKGIRNLFGKLRRSNSGNLELSAVEQAEPEFRRGGARATAGGRIEWPAQTLQIGNLSKGYNDWSAQEVCNWLVDLGLGCYEDDCRKWLKANPNVCFFTASPVDIERELNIKTPLHRKKIMLAIDVITGKEDDKLALKAAVLDVGWVMRWLDDIGLPQYKDNFLHAKVDGSMLHRLTLEDLTHLHVSSCLHVASLHRGIQCMREMNWHPECLIRRSIKASTANEQLDGSNDNSIESLTDTVSLWTAHRVMEWLRVADLSEYAPNLRGAGVHGALMCYEPRFNANLLADLLSIPPSKTLLRRHLATHFKELIGREVMHAKRDAESAPGYQPLTLAAKLKPPKKAQFSLKRRKSSKGPTDIEWTDYVCPMTLILTGAATEHRSAIQQQASAHNSSSTSSSTNSTNNTSSIQSN